MIEEREITTKNKSIALKIAITAIMAALTCVVTMAVAVYIPGSYGFFNIGESIVYLSAILFGPIIGAISGGVGSMIADIFLGYSNYAPGTLVIKGLEGFLVGYVYLKLIKKNKNKTENRTTVLLVSSAVSVGILIIGILYYLGEAELSGFNYLWVITTDFSYLLWIVIALISFIAINSVYMFMDQNVSLKIISMFIGGIVIVLGYYLYASFILGNVGAYVEIPFNFLQSLLGITISVPLIDPIKNRLKLSF